jgi:hypothetical protein
MIIQWIPPLSVTHKRMPGPTCRLIPQICHSETMNRIHSTLATRPTPNLPATLKVSITPLESELTNKRNHNPFISRTYAFNPQEQHKTPPNSNYNSLISNRLTVSRLESALTRYISYNPFIFILFTFCYTNFPPRTFQTQVQQTSSESPAQSPPKPSRSTKPQFPIAT